MTEGTTPPQHRRRKIGTIRLWPSWLVLGFRAYWRAFACRRFGCEGGGRDFAWLTLLLTLVTAMALLGVGGRAGFLDRLADTLLGTLKPHGIPVWITPHWANEAGIQSSLLKKLEGLDIGGSAGGRVTVHPYRRLENGRPAVTLPGATAWRGEAFIGWAVYSHDPLWLKSLEQDPAPRRQEEELGPWLGLPMEVILSESAFRRHFNYAAYRDLVTPLLEGKTGAGAGLPASLAPDELRRRLNVLWLSMTVSQQERLIPFQVRWVSHIPAMEQVAFLFPLSTYHALQAAHHLPELAYRPENKGRGDLVEFRQLVRPDYPRDKLVAYAKCVQREVESTGLTGLPRVAPERCPPPMLVGDPKPGDDGWRSQWDTLNHDREHRLWLPCYRLPQTDALRGSLCPTRPKGPKVPKDALFVPWDVTGYGTPFTSVRIFVPDAGRLGSLIKTLEAVKTEEDIQAFNVHPMYHDALSRFNLLSDLLGTLIPAYALSFVLLLTALLMAQIGGVIDRRRNHYGILMSRGFTFRALYAKVLFQMTIASVVGAVLAVGLLVPVFRWFLDQGFRQVLDNYRELLPPDHGLNVMPLSPETIGITLAGVYLAVVVVTLILLVRMPLWSNTTPSDLLHGNRVDPQQQP
ncbi:MAG: hypothetical protein HQL82_03875 [Magnetococcales bacterium]|nr:hypothetical protein [Magnetococcales bacterium]